MLHFLGTGAIVAAGLFGLYTIVVLLREHWLEFIDTLGVDHRWH